VQKGGNALETMRVPLRVSERSPRKSSRGQKERWMGISDEKDSLIAALQFSGKNGSNSMTKRNTAARHGEKEKVNSHK